MEDQECILYDSSDSFSSSDENSSSSSSDENLSSSSDDALRISTHEDNDLSDLEINETQLYSKDDYPEGSWLGNENKTNMRVRCPLSPMELAYVNTTCSTPKKMATALVNRLFSSENKENDVRKLEYRTRLDPILMYGIQCHLVSMFGITEEAWMELKWIIDSKYSSLLSRRLEDMKYLPRKHIKEIRTENGTVKRVGSAQLQFLSKAVETT